MGEFSNHMKRMEAAQRALEEKPREKAPPAKRDYQPEMRKPIYKNYEDNEKAVKAAPKPSGGGLPANLYEELDKAYKKNQK